MNIQELKLRAKNTIKRKGRDSRPKVENKDVMLFLHDDELKLLEHILCDCLTRNEFSHKDKRKILDMLYYIQQA